MKKLSSLVALVCMTMTTLAQGISIQLYVYAPEQAEEIPEASVDYLVNGLCTAVTTDGLAAQTDYMTQFLLMPKVNVATKNILANTQQQVVLTLDVSLHVVDNISGTIYASKTINLKGVGTNETKAYNAAFRTLSKNHQQSSRLYLRPNRRYLHITKQNLKTSSRRQTCWLHKRSMMKRSIFCL